MDQGRGHLNPSLACSPKELDADLRSHNLTQLLERLERRLDSIAEINWVGGQVSVAIKAIGMLDADAQRFRYPFQTKGRGPSFGPNQMLAINLSLLRKTVEQATLFLVNVRATLQADIWTQAEVAEEWKAELRRMDEEEPESSLFTYSALPEDDSEATDRYLRDWDLGSLADRSAEMLDDGDAPESSPWT